MGVIYHNRHDKEIIEVTRQLVKNYENNKAKQVFDHAMQSNTCGYDCKREYGYNLIRYWHEPFKGLKLCQQVTSSSYIMTSCDYNDVIVGE